MNRRQTSLAARSFRFRPAQRLKTQREFQNVYDNNVYAADKTLVVQLAPSPDVPDANRRIGLSVSRKVGNAVIRNRWKRLIREAFRLSQERLPAGVDIVVRPRKGAVPQFDAVQQSLVSLCRRAAKRLVKTSENAAR